MKDESNLYAVSDENGDTWHVAGASIADATRRWMAWSSWNAGEAVEEPVVVSLVALADYVVWPNDQTSPEETRP